MKAQDAKNIATKAQESGLKKILETIELQAKKGEFGLSLINYSDVNPVSKKMLRDMGYNVKWISIGENDGYWQINW